MIVLTLESIILCTMGSLLLFFIIILLIALCVICKKGTPGTEKEALINTKKLNKTASKFNKIPRTFHFKNKAFILNDKENSTVNYTVMFKTETEKLALKIKDIRIGGKTNCVKSHLSELNQVFFRILLNNNALNSIITSELYHFTSRVIVDEVFLFSLTEFQLKITSVIIEVFITLTSDKGDLCLGWLEINLPDDPKQYPLIDNLFLKGVQQDLDLYLKSVGYVCISLQGLTDKIVIMIMASNFENVGWMNENEKEISVFFNLLLKNDEDESINHTFKTSLKVPLTNVCWNEIFFLDVPNKLKRSSYIVVELWKTLTNPDLESEETTFVGVINLGLTDQCPEKSKMHWNYIVDKEDEENIRWHSIRSI